MSFWQAIRNLIQGMKVTRAGLEGQYLLILSSPANTAPDIFICDDNVNSKERYEAVEDDFTATDWATL